MGAYSLETLIRKWGRGELTVEQVIGQVLLHLQDLHDAVAGLERRLYASSGSGHRRRPAQDEDNHEEDRS